METTKSTTNISEIKNHETNSLCQFEISEAGKPIPFNLFETEEGGKRHYILSLDPEICSQNVNIAKCCSQSTSATSTVDEEVASRPAKIMRINNNDDEDRLDRIMSDVSESEDDQNSDVDHESIEHDSSSDEDLSCRPGARRLPIIVSLKDYLSASSNKAASLTRFELNKTRDLLISPPRTPIEAFRWFISDHLLGGIARSTNKLFSSEDKSSAWKDLTCEELLTFLGLLLHTGTMRMSNLAEYWVPGYLFNLPRFSDFMPRTRFMKIYTSLDIVQESTNPSSDTPLEKFQFIVDNFNKTMKEIYYPGKHLTLTTSTVNCQKKNVPKSKAQFLMLTDSNGIVVSYQVKFNRDRVSKHKRIVNLSEHLHEGHVLYLGKNSSSYKLTSKLLERNTYSTARLSSNERRKLEQADSPAIHIVKHCSGKRKCYISTEDGVETVYSLCNHEDEFQTIGNYRKCFSKTSKKLLETLSSYRPCLKVMLNSRHALLGQALQICLNNAFHLYNVYSGEEPLSLSEFRMRVLTALLTR